MKKYRDEAQKISATGLTTTPSEETVKEAKEKAQEMQRYYQTLSFYVKLLKDFATLQAKAKEKKATDIISKIDVIKLNIQTYISYGVQFVRDLPDLQVQYNLLHDGIEALY